MKVLLTGNRGYIGTVLTKELQSRGHHVTGLDIDYYADCELEPIYEPEKQIIRDIREATAADFQDIEAVIHLAAISNDPLGDLNEGVTEDINLRGTLNIAKLAKAAGIKRFVYASSQSMYGVSDTSKPLPEDDSEKNPVTAYARTKWEAECALKEMADDNFTVVCMRPSTVFGASPRLRCDIVFNYFVACANTTGKIEVKSDGTPWRPVVHVKDVSKAFIAGLEAPKEIVAGESFNVGIENGNFTVRDLAEAAQNSVNGSSLVFTGEHGNDSRTYRVSFEKIFAKLNDYYKPEWNLNTGGQELADFFQRVAFTDETFRSRKCTRLKQIQHLIENKQLSSELKRL